MTETSFALRLSRLRVQLANGDAIVDGVDLELKPGEIIGLVGESGSGKTTTALSILGYTSEGAEIASIDLSVAGNSLQTKADMRRARGRLAAYVPQDPGMALNPSLRVSDQINDMLTAHQKGDPSLGAIETLVETVGLAPPSAFTRRFPHQLSGGQQQRVCIAVALACEPALVVLDEPTTGLDVVTQAQILEELRRLRREQHVSMLYVTHDLAVVAQIADQIAVMYAGRIVEQGRGDELLRHPRHPYTRGLLSSIPDHVKPRALMPMEGIAVGVGDRPAGCAFAPRCPQRVPHCEDEVPPLEEVVAGQSVRCFEWTRTPPLDSAPLELAVPSARAKTEPVLKVESLGAEHRTRGGTTVAARVVSFAVDRGACVALVGESGSGKTTIAHTIAGLHPPSAGKISLSGKPLAALASERSVDERRRIQIVFQSPADALNPRHKVRRAIARPARLLRGLSRNEADDEVKRLLDSVRLPGQIADRYPGELSGGESQRVAIARALAAEPELILCDEITSALDVSVQAAVLSLIADLRADLGVSVVFITHDLGVVATVADYLVVLESGVICEEGPTGQVLNQPNHPYTRRLLASAPSLSTAIQSWEAEEAGGNR